LPWSQAWTKPASKESPAPVVSTVSTGKAGPNERGAFVRRAARAAELGDDQRAAVLQPLQRVERLRFARERAQLDLVREEHVDGAERLPQVVLPRSDGSNPGSSEVVSPRSRARANSEEIAGRSPCCRKYDDTCR
jgi:hypothetical protein